MSEEDLSNLTEQEIRAKVEETLVEVPAEEVVENKAEVVEAIDPLITSAREKGWRPKEEWNGDPDEWVDAKEFVAREPFFKKINKQSKEIKQLKEAQAEFRKHYEKVEQAAKEKAMQELKAQLEAASEDRDVKRAIEVNNKIQELENKEPTPASNEAFDEWVADNTWYNKDPELRAEAIKFGYGIHAVEPDKPLEEIYKEVTKLVKKAYPEKFENPNRQKQTVVDTGGKQAPAKPSKKQLTVDDLPEEARQVYRKLIRSGALTHDEFMRDFTQ